MRLLEDEEGSVLVTALVIIAVLLTLFLSAFSYGIARYSVHVKRHYNNQAGYLAESGINRLMALLNSQEISLETVIEDSLSIEIPEIGKYTVSIRPYGGYFLVKSFGVSGSQSNVRYSLLGTNHRSITDNALTIFDGRFPIVATGLTQIKGDLFSPSVQLTTGQIEGRGIVNENFHSGKRIIVDNLISPFRLFSAIDDYIEYVYQNLRRDAHTVSTSVLLTGDDKFLSDKDVISIQGNLEINDFSVSRRKRPLTIVVTGWVDISGKSELRGLIEIVSEKFIRLSDSSVFVGGLLYAEDSISLQDNSYFSAQAVSRHQMSVTDSCDVDYPSLLLTNASVFANSGDYGIRVASHLPTNAIIMYLSSDTLKQRDHEVVEVDSNAIIEGIVYSSDYLNLNGHLDGSAVTSNFKFEIPPTTYINWLKDITIDRPNLDYNPVLPIVKQDSLSYSIVYLRD